MLIFVCSPYSGDIERNTRLAKKWCREIIATGHIPFAPHLLYPQMLDENKRVDRLKGLSFGLAILPKCDAVWVFGNPITEGMDTEIETAKSEGIPIEFFPYGVNSNGRPKGLI
jgi:hypothetical protein